MSFTIYYVLSCFLFLIRTTGRILLFVKEGLKVKILKNNLFPDSLEEDSGLPYYPVQGQKRTSSLDKKKRKDRNKDSSCKQQ